MGAHVFQFGLTDFIFSGVGWRRFFDLEANADGNWLFLYTYGAGHMVGDWWGF